ncbi:MAG: DUF6427 family protein [Bacteroidetes bacterium]|nr:DUF6427 family protein [Bacteroidota bacterium]
MIRFFKSPQPAALFMVPVIVILLWLQVMVKQPAGMMLPFHWQEALPRFLVMFIAVALVSLEAIYMNNLFNRHEVLGKNSYLPAFLYVLLMSFALPVLWLHPVLIANIFLLVALDKTFSLFKNETAALALFDGGFMISMASFFYFPAVLFFAWFIISIAILRPFSFREWLIACIGFVLPYFFMSVYFFWNDRLVSKWESGIRLFASKTPDISFVTGRPLFWLFLLTGFLFLLSMGKFRRNFYKNVVKTRLCQQLLMLYMVFAVLSAFLSTSVDFFQLTLLAIPFSLFFSNYFLLVKKKTWIPELLLWSLIILIAWNHL